MSIKGFLAGVAIATLSLTACDDTTENIGASLTDVADNLDVAADTFEVTSRTIVADSVLARNIIGYLGRVKDPETGAVINGDFMVQFNTLEGFTMPDKALVAAMHDGKFVADSCDILLNYSTFYGDSLAPMKLTVYEMGKPMEEDMVYYSNFDPLKEGYVRQDGIRQNRTYTLSDQTESDSLRRISSNKTIRIRLNSPYTDAQGNEYNNYGSYLMQKYYEDNGKENFQNAYKFVHNVIPGFFFKITNGIGSMACIDATLINIYFRYQSGDSTIVASTSFAGTEEVLQTTTFANDKDILEELANDPTCTYVKGPAGLFTEITIPVEQIMVGHDNDTINTARIELPRINNALATPYALDIPQTLLIIPKDSLYSFFAHNNIADNKTSYLATYSSVRNSYTFDNISGMANAMANARKRDTVSENWNKAVLIPVTTTYTTVPTSTGGQRDVLTKITHDMSLTGTRLVGGTANPYAPLKISIIYSKFHGR